MFGQAIYRLRGWWRRFRHWARTVTWRAIGGQVREYDRVPTLHDIDIWFRGINSTVQVRYFGPGGQEIDVEVARSAGHFPPHPVALRVDFRWKRAWYAIIARCPIETIQGLRLDQAIRASVPVPRLLWIRCHRKSLDTDPLTDWKAPDQVLADCEFTYRAAANIMSELTHMAVSGKHPKTEGAGEYFKTLRQAKAKGIQR